MVLVSKDSNILTYITAIIAYLTKKYEFSSFKLGVFNYRKIFLH
ncbi:MAG: hypothetical protein JWM28_2532 [Chitinophagaceae bacterium]|nr:hypothetical protein [Chitinophagaceae bacterium]